MTTSILKVCAAMAALCALTAAAVAAPAAAIPWELKPDMGYAYGKDGQTLAYKMGTKNAKTLLKGAKKVPKGTLFFVGENGQLYMRSGPYLEGDGSFMFGADE
jgi:opacity protein-like surface antigen